MLFVMALPDWLLNCVAVFAMVEAAVATVPAAANPIVCTLSLLITTNPAAVEESRLDISPLGDFI